MLLSDRMRAVAALVSPCRSMADIGCDHGYVAIELIRSHTCEHVIAMDINRGPLARAEINICAYGMKDYIETRLSNGAMALAPNEAEGIICAGMGGRLVTEILEQSRELIHDMKQLVFQPQSELYEVRKYLRLNGYCIEKEDMVAEEGKYYPMMRVIPPRSNPSRLSELPDEEEQKLIRVQDTYGAYLLENKHPVLREYLLWQKESFENIRGNLSSSGKVTERQQQRIEELDSALSDIIFCLCNYFN